MGLTRRALLGICALTQVCAALAGQLAVQGRVGDGARLLDDVTGGGFTLVARAGDPTAQLGAAELEALGEVGVTLVSLQADAPYGVRDSDGRMSAWLADAGVHAVLVRPDFYVFGSAQTERDVPDLVHKLTGALIAPSAGVAN